MKKLRVLLISPSYRTPFGWYTSTVEPDVLADFPPLAIATLAAMVPPNVDVDLWDEVIQGEITHETPLPRHYDFVGVTGYAGHVKAKMRIAEVMRARGTLVGVGGPGVSIHPHLYRDRFDVLFIGEAEETWPQFLADLERGDYQREYLQVAKPDLTNVPPPDWRNLDLSVYGKSTIQTTRGCPFDCEFCDVIYIFGRRMRHRSVENVAAEFTAVAKEPADTVYLSDDEFVGDIRYTKELLRALIPINRARQSPKLLATQATINAARDTEFLELAADAGLYLMEVGIETPNPENLRIIGKVQNLNKDLVAETHKILSYGIALRGNIILGLDADDVSTFERIYRFHQECAFPIAMVNILMASEGTRMWRRLREEGRVTFDKDKTRDRFDNTGSTYQFNIIPKRMTRVELLEGTSWLEAQLHSWAAINERVCRWLSLVRRPPGLPDEEFSAARLERLQAGMEERFAIGADGRRAIDGMVEHLLHVAPFMWSRFRRVLAQMVGMRQITFDVTLSALDNQARLERSGRFVVTPDRSAPRVPRAFHDQVRILFPEVYKRIWVNLDDKDRTIEALTDVFVDFLVRWTDDLDEIKARHHEFLSELCDRTCAQYNRVSPEIFQPLSHDGVDVPSHLRSRVCDDVLRNIDIKLGFEKPPAEPVSGGGSQAHL